jgi:hypothetical protein
MPPVQEIAMQENAIVASLLIKATCQSSAVPACLLASLASTFTTFRSSDISAVVLYLKC